MTVVFPFNRHAAQIDFTKYRAGVVVMIHRNGRGANRTEDVTVVCPVCKRIGVRRRFLHGGFFCKPHIVVHRAQSGRDGPRMRSVEILERCSVPGK